MQIRNRLRTCSYPARALPVLLIPPPVAPTACPEGDAVHRPRSAKAAPGASRTVLGLAPAPGGPGTHWRNTAARGPTACPEGGEAPRARRTKAATQEAQDSLGTAPPAPGAWDPLGEYYNHRAADDPAAVPGVAVHRITNGLGNSTKPAIVCAFVRRKTEGSKPFRQVYLFSLGPFPSQRRKRSRLG